MSFRSVARFAALVAVFASGVPGAAVSAESPSGGKAATEPAAERPLQAHVLIVDSHAAISKWVLSPLDLRDGDNGRMRSVSRGKKIYLPVVATSFRSVASGRLNLSADLEIITPDGKTMASLKRCCTASAGDPRTPGLVVLNPVIDMESEPGDPLGRYTVRVTLSDGTRSATASESFTLVDGPVRRAPAVNAQAGDDAPPAPRRRSRANQDARACLDLPTPVAVARCAERYR